MCMCINNNTLVDLFLNVGPKMCMVKHIFVSECRHQAYSSLFNESPESTHGPVPTMKKKQARLIDRQINRYTTAIKNRSWQTTSSNAAVQDG